MRVIVACAGSGGHINPGIAIAKEIQQRQPTAEILFIGTKTGLENELVKKAGFKLVHIRAGRLHRYFTLENIKNMFEAILGIKDAKGIIKEFKPDIVIGTGGYICVPVCKAATKLKVPYVLHESNAHPGMSVKLVSAKASKILVGFEETISRIAHQNVVYTGTPTKFDILDIEKLDKTICAKNIELETVVAKGQKIIFVTGGSQGAKKFNDIVIDMVKKYKSTQYYVVIAVGHQNYDEIISNISSEELEELKKYIRIEKYIYDIEQMYKLADLMVTRAGAMTITELAIIAKPAILIPLPSAAENHQLHNAEILQKAGAGVVIDERELTPQLLHDTISTIVADDRKLKQMAKNSAKLYVSNVNEKIYNEILEVVKSKTTT